MFVNPYMLPALCGSIILYIIGYRISDRIHHSWVRWVIGATACILCLPAISFALYYAHLLKESWAYIELRSIPGIEMSSAWCGLLLGYFTAPFFKQICRHSQTCMHTVLLAIALLTAMVPFCKPLLNPVEKRHPLGNRWDGPVCLQTAGSTCGPASLTTIYAYYGRAKTEREIARECYASGTGTELWYLVRYARLHGLHVSYQTCTTLSQVPAPALIGATPHSARHLARSGHFVTFIGVTTKGYIIGDPLIGIRYMNEQQFTQSYGTIRDVLVFEE